MCVCVATYVSRRFRGAAAAAGGAGADKPLSVFTLAHERLFASSWVMIAIFSPRGNSKQRVEGVVKENLFFQQRFFPLFLAATAAHLIF